MAGPTNTTGEKRKRRASGPRKVATLYFLQRVVDANGDPLAGARVINEAVTKNTQELVRDIARLNKQGIAYEITQYPSADAQPAQPAQQTQALAAE